MCILSCPSSSIANCKTCTYSADNFKNIQQFSFAYISILVRKLDYDSLTETKN
jgi:hypothetical protein